MPEPPSPALTLTTTRSMNTRYFPRTRAQSKSHRSRARLAKQIGDRIDVASTTPGSTPALIAPCRCECSCRSCVRRRARRDDAELAAREVEAGTRQHFAVAFDDHPVVERGMQVADVLAQTLVHVAVHRGAGRSRRSARHIGTRRRSNPAPPAPDDTRRHSRIALSARGNPANRYVCRMSSSTHSRGNDVRARAPTASVTS